MRLSAELVLGLLALGLLSALALVLTKDAERRRWAQAARSAQWEDGHYSSSGMTHVRCLRRGRVLEMAVCRPLAITSRRGM